MRAFFFGVFLLLQPASAQFSSVVEYLSVGEDEAPVRLYPADKAEVVWKMWKYMPVEIIGYKGDWRKIRDLDGDTGWMDKKFLSDIPTVMVSAKFGNLRASRGGKVEWILDRGFPLRVFGRKDDWLEVSDLKEVSGWLHKSVVWGAVDPK